MFGSWSPSQYIFLTASKLVKKAAGLCTISGILCGTSSSGIIQVWDTTGTDATAGAVQVTDSITLVAGTPYPIPAKLNMGLYIKLVSGSAGFTVFFD